MIGWRKGLLVLVLVGAGCKSTPELGDTGLPESTALAALSSDDWQTFCTAADAARRKSPEDECRVSAFDYTRGVAAAGGSDADVRATCQAGYDQCMGEPRPPASRSSICGFGPVGPDCSAVVGEAESCLKDGVALRRDELGRTPTCASVTADQARATAGTFDPDDAAIAALPSCQAFNAKCPGLFFR